MSFRQLVRAWAPPVLIRLAQRVLDRVRPAPWEYVPGGWQTRDTRIAGWNVPSIAQTQKQKWPAFVTSITGTGVLGVNHEAATGAEDLRAHNMLMAYGYVLALAARHKERIALLDWGGGIGHYYVLSRALLPGVAIDYHCQDLPLLCEIGRELLPDAHFYDEPDACFKCRYDLVLAGSSLWYEQDWRATADKLAAAADDYLYLTRMVFVQRTLSYVAVQRPRAVGYRTEYLAWILNRDEFVDHVAGRGMKLIREFLISEGPHIHKAPEQGDFRGFLFRRQG